MKKEVLYFLNSLEGYHSLLKTLHWSTRNHSEHLLTDSIDGSVLSYEDKLAEEIMGITGERINVGELKTLLPESKTTETTIKELKDDIISLKGKIGDNAEYSGLQNILDDFMQDVNTWAYLVTLH